MSIYPIAYMVKIIIFHKPTSHIHHHLSLFTLCGKRVKQSQTVRSGRFESNLLTWPGRPKHTHGNRVTHATVPFNSRFTEQAHRPRLQESTPRYGAGSWAFLHPHVAAWETMFKDGGKVCSGCGSIQYLSLQITIFLGMWLIRSKA